MVVEHIWGGALPQRLYKYMRRAHADALMRRGEMLLSGLESYPHIDEDEGTLTTDIDSLGHQEIHGGGNTAGTISRNLAGVLNVAECARGTKIEGCEIVRRTGNYLVFCTSAVCSLETMHACNPEYDSCVEIVDVAGFLQNLTSFLSALVDGQLRCVVGDCRYQSRNHSVRAAPPVEGYAVAFIKPRNYAIENEFRFLWTVQVPVDERVPVRHPALAGACRLRDLAAITGTSEDHMA